MDWTALPGFRSGLVSCLVVAATVAVGCGDDGEPPAEDQAEVCQKTCQQAADCGRAQNWQCVAGFCRVAPLAEGRCQHDRQCWAKFSGWRESGCAHDSCHGGEACIQVGNATYCAPEAPTQGTCPVGTTYDAERADGSGRVDVCANQQARCEQGTCRDPCDSDADCGADRTCDTSTGRCLCTQDSDCAGDLVCESSSGKCICENDQHCTREGYETCHGGTCGCADDAACEPLGASYTCASEAGGQ